MRIRRRRAAPPSSGPAPSGADASLFGPGRPLPYLERVARRRGAAKQARGRLKRALAGSGRAGRSLVVHLLELGAALALLRGIMMWSLPLAWIVGALLLAGLSVLISDDER
jgi:hypothetical protein